MSRLRSSERSSSWHRRSKGISARHVGNRRCFADRSRTRGDRECVAFYPRKKPNRRRRGPKRVGVRPEAFCSSLLGHTTIARLGRSKARRPKQHEPMATTEAARERHRRTLPPQVGGWLCSMCVVFCRLLGCQQRPWASARSSCISMQLPGGTMVTFDMNA